MKTKPLDVVYFVSPFARADLQYSIRSVAENLEFNRLWIYGGKRSGLKPDFYVERRNQKGATKWDRVRAMYREVCENPEITEDFILFHDDFFVLKPTDEIEPRYCATLKENAEMIEHKNGNTPSEYTGLLRRTADVLTQGGYSANSYELHTPFIFNQAKLLKILEDYPKEHCIRSIYANIYGIGGKKANDVKIVDRKMPKEAEGWRFVSTNNWSFSHGEVGDYLRQRFNQPCKYETDVRLVKVKSIRRFYDIKLNRGFNEYSKPFAVSQEQADEMVERGLVVVL